MSDVQRSCGLSRVRKFVLVLLGAMVMLAGVRPEGACAAGTKGATTRTSQTLTSHTLKNPEPFEVRWLKQNIALHNRLIKQVQLEIKLTTSTTIKAFAKDLNTTLGQEMTQMQTWLKSWYHIAAPAVPAGPAMAKDPVITALLNQDLIFLNQLICYEHSVIQLAVFASTKATHTDLKAFAKKSITNGQVVLALANGWEDLLIKFVLEQYFSS